MNETRLREKSRLCVGCTENFYNGNNPLGVKFCWSLQSARLVKKVRVYVDHRPPWYRDEVKVYNCRRERRITLMEPKTFDANMQAYRAAVARREKSEATL